MDDIDIPHQTLTENFETAQEIIANIVELSRFGAMPYANNAKTCEAKKDLTEILMEDINKENATENCTVNKINDPLMDNRNVNAKFKKIFDDYNEQAENMKQILSRLVEIESQLQYDSATETEASVTSEKLSFQGIYLTK